MSSAQQREATLIAQFNLSGFAVQRLDAGLGYLLSRDGETWHCRDVARLEWLAKSLGVAS